jgi:hypothetical protein
MKSDFGAKLALNRKTPAFSGKGWFFLKNIFWPMIAAKYEKRI